MHDPLGGSDLCVAQFNKCRGILFRPALWHEDGHHRAPSPTTDEHAAKQQQQQQYRWNHQQRYQSNSSPKVWATIYTLTINENKQRQINTVVITTQLKTPTIY